MDTDTCSGGTSPSFAFAFNDSNFSDRVLHIEIVAGASGEAKSSGEPCSTVGAWARQKKRRRGADAKDKGTLFSCLSFYLSFEEQIMTGTQPEPDDAEEEGDVMIEESPTSMAGNQDQMQSTSSWNSESSTVLRVKTIHISSAILAAKSRFFYKLFSNGMRESEQKAVTLRITDSEEVPVMDMLQFMYTGGLQANTAPALLDVLVAADKFEVATCMRHCSRLLRELQMTPESALVYLDLPSSVLLPDAVQSLTDAAKAFLADRYKDIGRFHEDVMHLPLAGLEAVLSSDDLQVASEDAVYDFVLKWARAHYAKIEERREIFRSKLVWLIRFPMMSSRKLRKVLVCNDIEHDLASKLVMEALSFKAEPPHRQKHIMVEEIVHKRFSERAYKYRPVKVVEFDAPYQQCLVFLDLRKEECLTLWPQGRVYSQAFHLGGQCFFLSAHCSVDQQTAAHCFGLFLGMQEKGSVSFAVEYEFAARSKQEEWKFAPRVKGNYVFTGGKAVGYRNLFSCPWQELMKDDSDYFHQNVLHLRAELTIKPQGQGM
ncbi:ubiquitin-protein ligase, POB1 [Selaginella moellendorffii]|uniref:Ubiquitin-protein ligase, POB1 n=1 Tax=Selaginella moellendorffii TaxID=88036 RepID=D8QNY9_SELML|nr:ubiquitin-protein ligase, POB1 [Selaginella moellendorffii]